MSNSTKTVYLDKLLCKIIKSDLEVITLWGRADGGGWVTCWHRSRRWIRGLGGEESRAGLGLEPAQLERWNPPRTPCLSIVGFGGSFPFWLASIFLFKLLSNITKNLHQTVFEVAYFQYGYDWKIKNYSIQFKLMMLFCGLSRSLNLILFFLKTNWRIQYGGLEKIKISIRIATLKFRITYSDFNIRLSKKENGGSNMVDWKWKIIRF